MTASKTQTTDSTDRLPALTTRTVRPSTVHKVATRLGGAARRFLNALMRSLANPHV